GLSPAVAATSAEICGDGGARNSGLDPGSPTSAARPRSPPPGSASRRTTTARGFAHPGPTAAGFGLAPRDLAGGEPRAATLSLCPTARLGSARLALRQARPTRRGVAVDRMASWRKATRQILVGPTGFCRPGAAALGSHGSCPVAY